MARIDAVVNLITYCIALLAFCTVVQHINSTVIILFAVLFALSLYRYFWSSIQLPSIAITLVSIIIILISATRVEVDDFIMPSIEALTLLLGVKLIGDRAFRDYMQIFAMSLLLLAGSTLIDIRAYFLIYFLFMVILLNAAVVLLAFYSEDRTIQFEYATVATILYKTSAIAVIAIPLTTVFFFILPRSTYPLLTFLNIGRTSHSGFTDQVQLGDVTEIQANNDVVFRAHMNKIIESNLYWRGVVMDAFDGRTWRSTEPDEEAGRIDPEAGTITQTIYLEPTDNKRFFALDRPVHIQHENRGRIRHRGYRSEMDSTNRIRYTARSIPSPAYATELQRYDKYLQLHAGLSRETVELVMQLTAGKELDGKISALAQYFRRADYRYSLENLPISEHPVDDFILKHRYGNCEYFASALAIMLRVADIPSRVVGGYRGGTYNDMGQYYMVTQNDAHLWVEAYMPGSGWLRLEPTPPLTIPPKYYKVREFFRKIGLMLDTINYYWNVVVINYSFGDQLRIVSKLAQRARDFQLHIDRPRLLVMALLPMLAGLMLFFIKARLVKKTTPAMKLIGEFNAIMKSHGYRRTPNEGLEEFLDRIVDADLRERTQRFVVSFEKVFYRDRPLGKAELLGLRVLLREI
jgi:protein-glutamine gamma-glutamyltransferase